MTITVVSTTAQLIAVLSGSITGDTIKLAPGVYSNVNITGKSFSVINKSGPSQVYIESEFANNPAVLTDMNIQHSQGLAFLDLKLSTSTDSAGPFGAAGTTPFNISQSGNISLRSMTVSGSSTGTLANTLSGFYIRSSSYVTITQSNFSYLHNAINQTDNSHVTVTNNTFNHIYDDGIRGGGTSNILISGNSFTNFHMDPTDTDHPDCIQFWTTNETTSARNITVLNNTYTRGTGGAVQGVFIRDEVGDLPYYNITVQHNSLAGTMWNGIAVYDVNGGNISNNTLVSYLDYSSNLDVYDSRNVVVESNSAGNYAYTGSTLLTLANNVTTPAIPAPTFFAMPENAELLQADMATPNFGSAVPEPRSWLMMILGMGGLGLLLRKRKSALGALARA